MMALNSSLLLSILMIFTSCSGQNNSQISSSTVNSQNSNPITHDNPDSYRDGAIGDTVKELSNSIWYVFQDKNKIYWFGSNGQGVYRYNPSDSLIAGGKYFIHFTTKDGLCNDQIRGIKEDKAGNIYFNTGTGAISKFDGQGFTTLNITKTYPTGKGWKLESNDMWFAGAQDSGVVYRYDGNHLHRLEFPKTKAGDESIAKFPRSKFPNAKYSPYDVYSIYKDSKGSIWFGTATLGACRYDGKSFDWMYEEHLTSVEGGGSFGIRSIIEDKEGKFWFCNTRYRYDIYSKENTVSNQDKEGLINYKREKGVEHLIAQDGDDMIYYMSIIEDNKRNLWMATYRLGVWQYDPSAEPGAASKKIIHYPVKDGSKDITVFTIYKDTYGDLWLGTHEAGAYKFNGKTFEKFKL